MITSEDLHKVLDYHLRTKHRPRSMARGPGRLDFSNQPDPFRRYIGATEFRLERKGWHDPVAGQMGPVPVDLSSIFDTDGKYITVTNGRTLTKSMVAITDYLHEKYGNTPLWVTVLHGRFADKADALSSEIKQKLNIAKLEVQRISPVLGVHTGPGIVGAAVVPMELMGDLTK